MKATQVYRSIAKLQTLMTRIFQVRFGAKHRVGQHPIGGGADGRLPVRLLQHHRLPLLQRPDVARHQRHGHRAGEPEPEAQGYYG